MVNLHTECVSYKLIFTRFNDRPRGHFTVRLHTVFSIYTARSGQQPKANSLARANSLKASPSSNIRAQSGRSASQSGRTAKSHQDHRVSSSPNKAVLMNRSPGPPVIRESFAPRTWLVDSPRI